MTVKTDSEVNSIYTRVSNSLNNNYLVMRHLKKGHDVLNKNLDALQAELTNTFNGYSQLNIVAKKHSPGARVGWKPGLGSS